MSVEQAIEQRDKYLDTLRKLRKEATAEIDRLLTFLDAVDGDPDLEPSLGAPEQSLHWIPRDQSHWAEGARDEREAYDSDDEPSVGFDEEGDVLDRGEGDRSDFEPDNDAESNGEFRGGSVIGADA